MRGEEGFPTGGPSEGTVQLPYDDTKLMISNHARFGLGSNTKNSIRLQLP